MFPKPWLKICRSCLLLAVLAFVLPAGGLARTRYVAFGDSITEAVGFDEDCACTSGECRQLCGYPRRLKHLLIDAGYDVGVLNYGLGGERTDDGLTRLDEVLDEVGGDVLLLMEGTNDITRNIGPETTLFNLDEMARKAALQGLVTVHATLIPRYPEAWVDADNVRNRDLAQRIRELAFTSSRELVDPFEVFSTTPDLFAAYYAPNGAHDPVGHPNARGFDLLAEVFFDVLTGRDQVPPVVAYVQPADGAEEVAPLTAVEVRLYDFGDGIDLTASTLMLNDVEVAFEAIGGVAWQELTFQPLEPLSDTVAVRVRAADLAEPANTMDRQVTAFTVSEDAVLPCVPDTTTLCIDDEPGDQRFRVTLSWHTALGGGQSGDAEAIPLAPVGLRRGGLFSFFEIANPEMLIKVLNACSVNNRFWVFGAPTTTLGYELVVVDTVAALQGAFPSAYEFRETNEDGTAAPVFTATSALNTCGYRNPPSP